MQLQGNNAFQKRLEIHSSEQQPIAGGECPVSKGSRGGTVILPHIKKKKKW